ncbi:LysM peptidoglycan-binding domain-containing protein [Francisella noatunensis]|uniref:LysM peptidoglycan-binding domain-containing protein n=1 Tax=Francisella noatunensis TaxID=657445 RepID=A0A9Q2KPH5_9GAMM|nr:LysM peptidoglycan-binding domain-containing protein [Francisella noatunensis]MBK2028467.1 LysM peptidoglycan-binding domain-containing protein [Francisella noatunensis]MBK2033957.1 LysM peptidoglycan-binding domain-containing protein [Francisella noatunensis]MBK2049052.1 LysM peptidoglycan-binding domain-containing protein [Francisella noatunensis]MBK2049514.1 LysM peptidoglycan-binding domain-containing protein [Francisella noatunensis]MBK2050981.1 LysM peptidoglycan-binding domain-contai
MFKGINRVIAVGCALAMAVPVFAMEIYTVKSNDYLYKIAKSHSINGVSTSELTDAIKGINKSEIPGIVDNRIKVGDKLAIPTTKGEVEDGLTLTRNQMIQGSYNQPSSVSTTPKLDDQIMVSSDSESDSSSAPNVLSEDKIPTLIPGEENTQQSYKSNLDSQINPTDIQENESYEESSFSFLGSLFKFIVYVIVLAVVIIVGRRFWETRSTKKEQELEIISRQKRDHLMSRISPVVSGNEFYSSRKSHNSPQEEFDFFNSSNKASSSAQTGVNLEDSENNNQDNLDINESDEFAEIVNDLYADRDNNIVVKTERGVVFETSTDESLLSNSGDSEIQEIDAKEQAEQELQYVNELVEQFLDSEKYVEASITIQDSLEKNPNNIDLRYKLLEVYAQAGDEIAFEGEVHFIKSKNIVSMFDPLHQKIAKLRDKYFE